METTYKTPTEEDKAKALKLLESLEEWHTAKETGLLDVDDILDYIYSSSNNLNLIKLFLDIVNTKEENLRDKKLVDFILSFKDEDLIAFVDLMSTYGNELDIRFFKKVKIFPETPKNEYDYKWDYSSQETIISSNFAKRITYFAQMVFQPKLKFYQEGERVFKIYKNALKTINQENNYSVKRFEELVRIILEIKSEFEFWSHPITPPDECRASLEKRLKALKGWEEAISLNLVNKEYAIEFLYNHEKNIKPIGLLLDLINTKDPNLKNRKFVNFILSYENEDLNAFIDTLSRDGIIFLNKQDSILPKKLSDRILPFAEHLLDPNLPTSNLASFVEFKYVLKILRSENNYSIKRFDELVKNIYLYP